ncbi:MAG: hypothetical protein IPK10_17480 [Bacteroidetes bacterium]|nr:hypothetical protein [Bacteroidota bacterium]
MTKDSPEYGTNRFKYENGMLSEVNVENGYNSYTECVIPAQTKTVRSSNDKIINSTIYLLTPKEVSSIVQRNRSYFQYASISIDEIKDFFKRNYCNENILDDGRSFNCYGGENDNCAFDSS